MGFVNGVSIEQIENLKEEFVLTILNSKGVNLEEFKSSELYHAHETKFFIQKLYELFHELNPKFNPGFQNDFDKQMIVLSKLFVKFENNILEITLNEINNKYHVIDKRIYVNGNRITEKNMFFVETLDVPGIPREKAIAARKQLQEDLNSCRIRTEDALAKSLEFAKTFKVR